jgi:hypothetical protein
MSGFRVALIGIGLAWLAAFVLASRVEFVPATLVDQATLPLAALLGLGVALVVPLPPKKIGLRMLVWMAATGLFLPVIGLDVPVASTYVFAEPTTVALSVTEREKRDGRGGECFSLRFAERPDLKLGRLCASEALWQSVAVGERLAAHGVRNGLGLRILKWEKLKQ